MDNHEETAPNFDPEQAQDEPVIIDNPADIPTTQTLPKARSNNPEFSRYGCITGVVLLALGTLLCSSGNRWLFEPESIFSTSFDGALLNVLLSGGSHVVLLVVAGIALWLFRQPRFWLVRGMGAGLLVAAVYSGLNTLLLAWEAPLEYPGIVDWIPGAVLLGVGLVFALWLGRNALRSALVPAALGLGLGLLITSPWAFAGSLGEPLEMLTAVAESLAFGVWFGLSTAMVLIFQTQETDEPHHPFWITVAVAGFVGTLLPTFLAGRGGWTMTAVLLTPALTTIPLIAMFSLWPAGLNRTNRWLPPAAFCAGFLAIPLLFFESIELTFMPEVSLKMAAGLFFVSIAAVFFGAVWLIARLVNPNQFRPVIGLGVLALGIIAVGIGAALTDGGAWQRDTFFVVMADQADTEFANDIGNRDERVTAVYETLVDHAIEDQAEVRDLIEQTNGSYTPFYLINALEVEGSGRLKRQLARRDDVAWVLDSPQARPLRNWFSTVTDVDMTTLSEAEPAPMQPVWGIEEIRAPLVWSEFDVRGEGIIVGSADSGVEFTHPALIDSYVGSVDNHDYAWFDPGIGNSSPADSGGHGTHTTGTVLGQFGIGVAPGAKWIACRNLPRNLGNPADYVACMEFLFAPFPIGGDPFTEGDPTRGAHVTNNSWGCPPEEGCDGRTIGIGVAQLRNAGQMMVVSNGNSGPECSTTGAPANNGDAFSVGALNPSGTSVAGFSSRGPAVDSDGRLILKPDIIAPGVEIVSSLPGDTYGPSQGTSMAGPHVAGAVALLWSAAPDLIGNVQETERILTSTARQIDITTRCDDLTVTDELNNISGHGVVDVYAAVKAAFDR